MPNSQLISDYIKHLEAIRKDSRERLHQSAIRWNELANSRSADLSKHLFTIAALILPLSVLPLTQNGFADNISILGKSFLIASWFCFIASLFWGLIHLSLEAKFFQKWAKQDNDRSEAFRESIFTTSATDAFDRLNQMNQQANRLVTMPITSKFIYLYLQQGFLLLGIILIGIILSIKLFSPSIENKNKQMTTEGKPYNVMTKNHKWEKRGIHTSILSTTPTPKNASSSTNFKSWVSN